MCGGAYESGSTENRMRIEVRRTILENTLVPRVCAERLEGRLVRIWPTWALGGRYTDHSGAVAVRTHRVNCSCAGFN